MKTKQGYPVTILFDGLHDKKTRNLDEMIKMVVYNVETSMKQAPPGAEKKYIVLLDRIGSTMKSYDKPYIDMLFPLLEKNYPETLQCSLVLRNNWLMQVLWRVVKPFLDAKTASKVRMVPNDAAKIKEALLEFFDEDQLWDFYGGKYKWKPENTNYLKLLSNPPPEVSVEEVEKEIGKIDVQSDG